MKRRDTLRSFGTVIGLSGIGSAGALISRQRTDPGGPPEGTGGGIRLLGESKPPVRGNSTSKGSTHSSGTGNWPKEANWETSTATEKTTPASASSTGRIRATPNWYGPSTSPGRNTRESISAVAVTSSGSATTPSTARRSTRNEPVRSSTTSAIPRTHSSSVRSTSIRKGRNNSEHTTSSLPMTESRT